MLETSPKAELTKKAANIDPQTLDADIAATPQTLTVAGSTETMLSSLQLSQSSSSTTLGHTSSSGPGVTSQVDQTPQNAAPEHHQASQNTFNSIFDKATPELKEFYSLKMREIKDPVELFNAIQHSTYFLSLIPSKSNLVSSQDCLNWVVQNASHAKSIHELFSSLTRPYWQTDNYASNVPADCTEAIVKVDPHQFNFDLAVQILDRLREAGLLSNYLEDPIRREMIRANVEKLFACPEFWGEILTTVNADLPLTEVERYFDDGALIPSPSEALYDRNQKAYDALLRRIYEASAHPKVTEALTEGNLLLEPLTNIVCSYVTFPIKDSLPPEPKLESKTELTPLAEQTSIKDTLPPSQNQTLKLSKQGLKMAYYR